MSNLKIAVAFHEPAQIDNYIKNKDIYIPIYSGDDQNIDMIKDDIGVNCSNLNREINQITQLFWFANNLDLFGNPDYIGLHHYRRFLKFDLHDLNPNTIQATCFNLFQLTVFHQLIFSQSLQQNWMMFYNSYLSFFPKDRQLFFQYMSQNWFYACNLFIMPKNIFEEYFKYMKFLIDLCYFFKRNEPQMFINKPRILSMYFERMTGFFLYKKQHEGVKIQNCPIITPQKYFKYILDNQYSGNYFIQKNNCLYKVNSSNYFLKELENEKLNQESK